MKRTYLLLLLICAAALLIRLLFLPTLVHPGVADPNYYYNLGRSLAEGRGFNIDFIWQYHYPPENIVHEADYWMPLNGVIVAISFLLFGVNVAAALLPFVLMGAVLPIVAFLGAKQFKTEDSSALFVAACTAFLPELMLHSLRSETTLPNALLICGAILCVTAALHRGRLWLLLPAGIFCGIAYLVRSDAALMLPMLIVTLVIYAILSPNSVVRQRPMATLVYAGGAIALAILVIAPWLIRNQQLFDTPTTPHLSRMFFLTHHDEHFAYDDDFTLETMLTAQTPAQLISKRAFELAAAVKSMMTSLEGFLTVAVSGGVLILLYRRDKERFLLISPVLILLFGLLLFYPLLIPMKSQGGSFKKAYLSLIPLLIPLAGYALEQAVSEKALRYGVMVLVVAILAVFSVDTVRLEAQFLRDYTDYSRQIVETVQSLPDRTGDGQNRLMALDPFMLSYMGIETVMTPRDDRDAALEVAARYGIDYLLSPTSRPALDEVLVDKTVIDTRFEFVTDIEGTTLSIFRFVPENN